MPTRARKLSKDDKKRLADIQRRMDKAELSPWRAEKGKYGCRVVEPYAAWGRHDVLIASGLDGATAAFLAAVPDDMRWLMARLEELK